jgi:hypothetical protein
MSLALTLLLSVMVLLASRWLFKHSVQAMARLVEAMVGGAASGQLSSWQPSRSTAPITSYSMPVAQPSAAELERVEGPPVVRAAFGQTLGVDAFTCPESVTRATLGGLGESTSRENILLVEARGAFSAVKAPLGPLDAPSNHPLALVGFAGEQRRGALIERLPGGAARNGRRDATERRLRLYERKNKAEIVLAAVDWLAG